MRKTPLLTSLLAAAGLVALTGTHVAIAKDGASAPRDYYGTLEPFASEAVYFVVTDRFVNGDPANDFRDQGGEHGSFDIPLTCPDGVVDNIGYLGGDFRGLLDHAAYIREMGFTAVWITLATGIGWRGPCATISTSTRLTCAVTATARGRPERSTPSPNTCLTFLRSPM